MDFKKGNSNPYISARMAEWSKATVLRSVIERCEGSNPSSCKQQQQQTTKKYKIKG